MPNDDFIRFDSMWDFSHYRPEYVSDLSTLTRNRRVVFGEAMYDGFGRVFVPFRTDDGASCSITYFGDGVFRLESVSEGISRAFDAQADRYKKYFGGVFDDPNYKIIINAVFRDFLDFREKRVGRDHTLQNVTITVKAF